MTTYKIPEHAERFTDAFSKASLAKADAARTALRKRVETFQARNEIATYEQAYTRALMSDPEARELFKVATTTTATSIDYDAQTGEPIEGVASTDPVTVGAAIAKQWNADAIAPLEARLREIEHEYVLRHDDGKGDPQVVLQKVRERLRGVSGEYQKLEAQIVDAQRARDEAVLEYQAKVAKRKQIEAAAAHDAKRAEIQKREQATETTAQRELRKRVSALAAAEGITYQQAYVKAVYSDPEAKRLAAEVRAFERAV